MGSGVLRPGRSAQLERHVCGIELHAALLKPVHDSAQVIVHRVPAIRPGRERLQAGQRNDHCAAHEHGPECAVGGRCSGQGPDHGRRPRANGDCDAQHDQGPVNGQTEAGQRSHRRERLGSESEQHSPGDSAEHNRLPPFGAARPTQERDQEHERRSGQGGRHRVHYESRPLARMD